MMQDRVFQVLQLLQHDVAGDYSISLTNQFMGTDVILNDSSISGYENMGFNMKAMTQETHQGQFMITTEYPIPRMPFNNRFTWTKYGHFILYSGIIPIRNTVAGVDDEGLTNKNIEAVDHNVSLIVNHRECVFSFLQTDPDGAASFIIDARSTCLIDEFPKNTF